MQVCGTRGVLGAGRGRCVFAAALTAGDRVVLLRGAGCLGAAVCLDFACEHGAVLGLVDALEGQGEGHGVGLAAAHSDGHVGEGVVDGGVRLVDGDLGADHALMAHDVRGDGFGQGLDEVDGLAGEDRHGFVGDVGVGDGGGDIVGGTRGLDPHDDVGTEALLLAALEIVDAVVCQRPQSFEGDDDASAAQSFSFQAMAAAVASTSWTRTAHAPLLTAWAAMAALSMSMLPPRALTKRLRDAPMSTGYL